MSDCKRCEELRNLFLVAWRQVERLCEQLRDYRAMQSKLAFAEQQAEAAKAEARRQRARAQDVAAELALSVIKHGVTHLVGCPEDDTCRCPHVERLNNLLNDYPVAP